MSARIFKGEIVWGLAFFLDTKNSYYCYDTILCPGHIIFVDSNHIVLTVFFYCSVFIFRAKLNPIVKTVKNC